VSRWIADAMPRLLRRYGVTEAWLFGSWARGDADRNSDIDLIVVTASDRPFVARFQDLPRLWQEAPAGLDLLIYTPSEFEVQRRSNRFVKHALRTGRRVV